MPDPPRMTKAVLKRIAPRLRALGFRGSGQNCRKQEGIEHAVDWYKALKQGELMIVPGTSHAMIVEKADLFRQVVVDFFSADPVPTFAPLRRR